MKYIFIAFFLITGLTIYGQDKNINSDSKRDKNLYIEIIKKVKNKLNRIFNPQKTTTISSVFGIRGNKFDSSTGLYWKTENSKEVNEKIKKEKEFLDMVNKKVEEERMDEVINDIENYIKENQDSFIYNDLKILLNELNKKEGGKDA